MKSKRKQPSATLDQSSDLDAYAGDYLDMSLNQYMNTLFVKDTPATPSQL